MDNCSPLPAALLLFCGFGLTIGSLVLLRYAVKSTRDVVYAMGVGLFFPTFFAGVLLIANFAFGVPFPFQVTAPCLAMPDRRSENIGIHPVVVAELKFGDVQTSKS